MTDIISVDPGVHSSYCVAFTRGAITRAWVQSSRTPIPHTPGAVVHCEYPYVYPGAQKGDPNDLIQLAVAVGAVCALNERKLYTPRAWKGNLPKSVHHARCVQDILPGELAILHAAVSQESLRHNIFDAAFLGFFVLGRRRTPT
jgi:hypothetical protein